jgi:hypothetical protein
MLNPKPRGKKRKLCTTEHCVLDESTWQKRKPSNLSLSHGFLPSDEDYKSKTMFDGTISISDGGKKRYGHRSKFHSVLQILMASLYRNGRFIAKPVAIAATTNLSSSHDSIFDLTESEFIFEYHRKYPEALPQCLPMVEQGLLLQVGLTQQVVKQSKLLIRVHTFINHFEDIICPSARPLLSIDHYFSKLTRFHLHFDSLHLLSNAEDKYTTEKKKNRSSAFDLLYDVWVCCYLPRENRYLLRYLPTTSWDDHSNGHEIQLSEFNKDIDTSAKLSDLSYWAMKAAKHYGFEGFDYIIPEYSMLYKDFMQNCIKA